MKLDETIRHCEEVADRKRELSNTADLQGCSRIAKVWWKNADEHRQLAEWLKELKQLKEKDEPRMVRYEGDGYADGEMVYDYAYCPNCDHETEADSENCGSMFCPECGQRLRWKVRKPMQLVIDLPERIYISAKEDKLCGAIMITDAIKNGTPLPKGHGDLIDKSTVKQMIDDAKIKHDNSKTFAENIIRFAPTIIEADKESEYKV